MTAHLTLRAVDQAAYDQFTHELELVRGALLEPLGALGSPLRELIHSRIESSGPPYLAAIVLCAAFSKKRDSTQYRVSLAAALEMLHVALAIHEQLLTAPSANTTSGPAEKQRTYIGANILAGDFCFSCSAQLAAHTGNPAVVATFASALQAVSENRLRTLLPEGNSVDVDGAASTDQIMVSSGVAAAMELSDLDRQGLTIIHDAVDALIESLVDSREKFPPSDDRWQQRLAAFPNDHGRRWLAFRHWLRDLDGE